MKTILVEEKTDIDFIVVHVNDVLKERFHLMLHKLMAKNKKGL